MKIKQRIATYNTIALLGCPIANGVEIESGKCGTKIKPYTAVQLSIV